MTLPWRRRTKRLSYRDQTGSDQVTHQTHWAGFEWDAGRVVVSYLGRWGEVQVWAATEEEGRRVIRHACAVAGIPTTGPSAGEWASAVMAEGRNGKPGRFGTAIVEGLPVVTMRDGPSGSAMLS